MSFSTFSGPVRVGTVRENAGRNTGLVVLSQTATVPATAALTSGAVAQALFTLPAGSRINRIMVEKTVAVTGNGVTQVAMTVGDGTTANKYVTSVNLATAAGMTAQATIDAGVQVAETSNIGTTDITFYGTFTATTGNPTAGTILVTVEYVQRNTDGAANPVSA